MRIVSVRLAQTHYSFKRNGVYTHCTPMHMETASSGGYAAWSKEALIARVQELEKEREKGKKSDASSKAASSTPKPTPTSKPFIWATQPRRKIALKFTYAGWEYNGLAFQTTPTPLPTVEGVLYDALVRARLIDPEGGMDGCGWEKCGRTDRGVSAAGQVISLWVRSKWKDEWRAWRREVEEKESLERGEKPLVDEAITTTIVTQDGVPSITNTEMSTAENDTLGFLDIASEPPSNTSTTTTTTTSLVASTTIPLLSKATQEHDYIAILNRLLPPTIRILSWSPVSPTFSARFNCSYRHYKYFFSNHDCTLDISRMRDAASRLLGEHDFRNLCKLDPAKQIPHFRRKVLRADISPVEGGNEGMFVLDLVGTAFLYHQVRHIMAVLLMVGTGVEHPSLVSSLLNVAPDAEAGRPGDPPLEVVDRKPEYQMADALPLLLWDCAYNETEMDWKTKGDRSHSEAEKGQENVEEVMCGNEMYDKMHSLWTRSTIYTTLDQHFLAASTVYNPAPTASRKLFPVRDVQELRERTRNGKNTVGFNIPIGGGAGKRTREYVQVLHRPRMKHFEVANERWRTGKGARKEERRANAEDGEDGEDGGDE